MVAISSRLQLLFDGYGAFASDPNARVLRWQLRADELRMAEAFIAGEQDERAGQSGDLFFVLQQSFEDAARHGSMLVQEFATGYADARDELMGCGIEPDWRCPSRGDDERDIPLLLRTLIAFLEHHACSGKLVMVLRPQRVTDFDAYDGWLTRLAQHAPANIRGLVLDAPCDSAPAPGARSDTERIWVREPHLDMSGAMLELARGGGTDNPGGKARLLLVEMNQALAAGELDAARAIGQRAHAIAESLSWWHLVVPIQLSLGSALASHEAHEQAIACYRSAEKAATRCQTEGPLDVRAHAARLLLSCRMAHGAALIGKGDWNAAGQMFEDTAPLASALADPRAELDCHRLASLCLERQDRSADAIVAGQRGMEVARAMDADTRSHSTFAYLGEALMRLARGHARPHQRRAIERDIETIAG